MENLKFSVTMCVYKNDNPEWFREALDSIYKQTRLPDEVVLVCDGPIPLALDNIAVEYSERYDDFKIIRLPENVGFGNACQVGVENSTYSIIARMDSDDVCVPDRFEKQIKCFESDDELDIVGGTIGVFTDSAENIVSYSHKPLTHTEIAAKLKKRSPLAHVTVMYKKESVQKAGGYIEWYCEEDYYLWARMIINGCKCKNIDDALVLVRTTPEQMGRRGGWKYFSSEVKMQKFLLSSKIINYPRFLYNILLRFIAEIVLPSSLRYQLRKVLVWEKNK